MASINANILICCCRALSLRNGVYTLIWTKQLIGILYGPKAMNSELGNIIKKIGILAQILTKCKM